MGLSRVCGRNRRKSRSRANETFLVALGAGLLLLIWVKDFVGVVRKCFEGEGRMDFEVLGGRRLVVPARWWTVTERRRSLEVVGGKDLDR